MAVENGFPERNRLHDEQIIEVFDYQDKIDDTTAQHRIDLLLFNYIFRHPERLKKWLDLGKHED